MAMEAIVAVEEAETAAERRKADAQREARLCLKQAEVDGAAAVEAAGRKAIEELKRLAETAEADARAEGERFTRDTAAELAELKTRAEGRLDEAAKLIVERIVNAK